MPGIPRTTTRSEDALITRRLLKSMPASRFEMETLCRLAGIHTSRSLPTAAVECKRRPRLLINPDFVAQYCKHDEHLFLLVMHELWHVLLAHTRMYPRMTPAQNIAFDAIINAGLMREFNSPEYMGFFDAINPADKFPSCLLRPPVGWPFDPQYPEDIGPEGTKDLLMRLYPPANLDMIYTPPLYEEVLSLLLKSGMDLFGSVFLLGNHDPETEHDPIMKDLLKQISAKWPEISSMGRGGGATPGRALYRIDPAAENVRRAFAQVLRICVGKRMGRMRRRAKMPVSSEGGTGVLPNPRDRLAAARRQLGAAETLWTQPATAKARIPERPSKAYVYLDVSGSMHNYLPHLLGLMLPYVANQQADVFQFSTVVRPLQFAELRAGQMTTTGGTDINCVLAHLAELEPKPTRVLLLTDGEVGAPHAELETKIREADMKLFIVMPDDGTLHPMVEAMATSVVRLPPIDNLNSDW